MRSVKLAFLVLCFLAFLIGILKFQPLTTVSGQSTALSAPTGVSASDGSYSNKVGIIWDAIRNATSYQVFRNTVNNAATAANLGSTADRTFFDTSAATSQNYYYWVRAKNEAGTSALSVSDPGFRAAGTTVPLSPPSGPPGNPVTAAKATLGKVLFWDEQLSSTRTVACGTCHHASNGGSDPRSIRTGSLSTNPGADGVYGNADDVQGSAGVPLTLADGSYQWSAAFGLREQVTPRRSLSHVDSGYPTALFWDGRALGFLQDPGTGAIVLGPNAALESQALFPLLNSAEMGHGGRSWNDVVVRVSTSKPLALSPSIPVALANWIGERNYFELFSEAFGSPGVTPVRIAMALATYQRSLYSDRTPFDVGDLTPTEARGQQIFTQARCDRCHIPPFFSDDLFQNTGVRPSSEDTGFFVVTQNQVDLGKFRTPSLRNVELRAPYMHNGRFKTLEAVVDFYDRGGDFPGPNTDRSRIRPLNLSTQQKSDLIAFMRRPLTDPRVAAETAPFDRPMLYSESARIPQITGTGKAGAGGHIPQVVAVEPPILGNSRFSVAVYGALGGAQATLVIDRQDPGTGSNIPANASLARIVKTLGGTGAGNGYTSASLAIPSDPVLVGATFWGRWYVNDASAAGGVSVTPAFRMTVFRDAAEAPPTLASVSAASFAMGSVSAESIVTGFGENLSPMTAVADSLPLPETLGGISVVVRDAQGIVRPAPLFFVSPTQINYLIPAGTASGEAAVFVRQGSSNAAAGLLQITTISPGLFTVDVSGKGLPAAVVLRITGDGSQSFEPISKFNTATGRFEAIPLDLGSSTDQLILVVFGTGCRNHSSLSNVTALIGGITSEVLFVGAQGSLIGVDQANIIIPREVAGKGDIDVKLQIEGKTSNAVTIAMK